MKHTTKLLLTLLLSVFTGVVSAQINPFNAQLFQNQYLANPAKAGAEAGARLNLGYKNQWSSMPGSPRNSMVSYDTRNNKVGLGVSVFNDKSGLINYTKVLGTYAYHLPLSGKNEFFHMGISVGIFRGTGEVRSGLVAEIIRKIPQESVIWEAPKKEQQVWFIQLYGSNVNLGNIAPNEIIPLETLRMGLRGDSFHFFLNP